MKNMKMNKILLTATLCAVLMFTAAACNNNSPGGVNSGPEPTPEVTEEVNDPTMPVDPEVPEVPVE